MSKPIRILLQTTIPFDSDNWHIGRFSLLREHLSSLKDESGNPLYEVTARDRETDVAGNDPVLTTLDTSDFDELWLLAIDLGDGLTVSDCQGITRFRQRGGGMKNFAPSSAENPALDVNVVQLDRAITRNSGNHGTSFRPGGHQRRAL